MKVVFVMSEGQIRAAHRAVSNLSDNEHDQGADGGTLQTLLEETVEFFATATPGKLSIPLPLFAIMGEAVETSRWFSIYFADPADESAPDIVQMRELAKRIDTLPD